MEEEKIKKNFSRNIVHFRKQAKLTQAKFASKLNYSFQAVSKWEKGQSIPDLVTCSKIAEFFGVPINSLISENKVFIIPKQRIQKSIFITILSIALNWFIFSSLFAIPIILGYNNPNAWLLFIYAIPSSAIILLVFSTLWFKKIVELIAVSFIIWGIGLGIFLSFQGNMIWLIFVICGILQIITILWYLLRLFVPRN